MIQATLLKSAVIAGSGQESGITTWMLTYPRFIHAEFMTHRMFPGRGAPVAAVLAWRWRTTLEFRIVPAK